MTVLREILARFGIEVDTKQVEQGHDKVDGLISKLQHFGHAVAGVFAFHFLESFVKETVAEADALDTAAQKAGMTANELQRLQHAASMTDVDVQALNASLVSMYRSMGRSETGSKKAAAAYSVLGISLTDAEKEDPTELFLQVADALSQIEDPAKQAATATAVFGAQANALLPMLKQGRDELEKYIDQVDELGGGYSNQFVELATQLDDHEKELGMLFKSMRAQIVGQLIPVFLQLGHAIERASRLVMQLNKDGAVLRALWVGGLVAIAARFGGLTTAVTHFAKTLALPLAGFLLMTLALDDIAVWFRGGDSLIGRFFDTLDVRINQSAKLFGEATAFASSSWDALAISLMRVPSMVSMAFVMIDNEITQAVYQGFAFLSDAWAKFLQSLNLPPWMQKMLGGDAENTGTKAQDAQRLETQRTREQIGSQFTAELDSADWQQYFKARDKWRAETAPQTTPGIPETTPWTGMVEKTQTQPVAAEHGAAAGPTISITDNSKHETHVTVPDTTPGTVAQKTADAVGTATKQNNTAILYSTEHAIEGT